MLRKIFVTIALAIGVLLLGQSTYSDWQTAAAQSASGNERGRKLYRSIAPAVTGRTARAVGL